MHAHGCRDCHSYYQDCCVAPDEPGLCSICRSGSGWPELLANRAPLDCCRAQAKSVTKDESARYKLVGQIPWLICPVCKRTHPYAVKGLQ